MSLRIVNLFINADGGPGGSLINGLQDFTPAPEPTWILGDRFSLRLWFRRSGMNIGDPATTVQLDVGDAIAVGGRAQDDIDSAAPLFTAGAFIQNSVGSDFYYEAILDLTSSLLMAEFEAGDSPLACVVDLKNENAGDTERLTLPQFLVNIKKPGLRVGDISPPAGDDPYPAPENVGIKQSFTQLVISGPGDDLIQPWDCAVIAIIGAAGSGTHTVSLSTQYARPGALVDIFAALPAVAGPVIQIRNDSATGALLDSIQGTATKPTYERMIFRFNGNAWIQWGPDLEAFSLPGLVYQGQGSGIADQPENAGAFLFNIPRNGTLQFDYYFASNFPDNIYAIAASVFRTGLMAGNARTDGSVLYTLDRKKYFDHVTFFISAVDLLASTATDLNPVTLEFVASEYAPPDANPGGSGGSVSGSGSGAAPAPSGGSGPPVYSGPSVFSFHLGAQTNRILQFTNLQSLALAPDSSPMPHGMYLAQDGANNWYLSGIATVTGNFSIDLLATSPSGATTTVLIDIAIVP